MTMLTSTNNVQGILPPDYGALVIQPVTAGSVAFQASNMVTTSAASFRIPIVTKDVTAQWVTEAEEIPTDNVVMDEIVSLPSKVARVVPISRELANDSSPQAAQIVGGSLARAIITAVDAAYFGDLEAPAPKGLEALTDVTSVEAGTKWENLDPFAEGIANAEQLGATITSWAANPADALALAQLKDEGDSNRPLLEPDATQPTRRMIQGVPLLASPAVTPGTIWGIPRAYSNVVLREGTKVEVDGSVYFLSDRVAVKGTMRLSFAFPHEAAIQKITLI